MHKAAITVSAAVDDEWDDWHIEPIESQLVCSADVWKACVERLSLDADE